MATHDFLDFLLYCWLVESAYWFLTGALNIRLHYIILNIMTSFCMSIRHYVPAIESTTQRHFILFIVVKVTISSMATYKWKISLHCLSIIQKLLCWRITCRLIFSGVLQNDQRFSTVSQQFSSHISSLFRFWTFNFGQVPIKMYSLEGVYVWGMTGQQMQKCPFQNIPCWLLDSLKSSWCNY